VSGPEFEREVLVQPLQQFRIHGEFVVRGSDEASDQPAR
jgi:hypothetical protein